MTLANRNVVLQKDGENTMNGACEKRRGFSGKQKQKKTYLKSEKWLNFLRHIIRKEGLRI